MRDPTKLLLCGDFNSRLGLSESPAVGPLGSDPLDQVGKAIVLLLDEFVFLPCNV